MYAKGNWQAISTVCKQYSCPINVPKSELMVGLRRRYLYEPDVVHLAVDAVVGPGVAGAAPHVTSTESPQNTS